MFLHCHDHRLFFSSQVLLCISAVTLMFSFQGIGGTGMSAVLYFFLRIGTLRFEVCPGPQSLFFSSCKQLTDFPYRTLTYHVLYTFTNYHRYLLNFLGMPHALSEVKAEKYDESPAKITVKIGDNIIIPCLREYRLTYLAWKLCHSNCQCSDAKWKPVITRGNGFTSLCDPEKYGLGLNGSLVVKNIQPWDNENWLRCFYKEPFVGTYHRTSIIVIKQGTETELG